MSTASTRRAYPVSLQQAAAEAPTLAALAALARDSADRLKAIETLIPPALRQAIQPGPIDGAHWCLLVTGNAAAAKLRQLLPALQARLRQQGWQVDAIRIKVLAGAR
ncbi:MAG: DciA family protein [Gammaproteobacteria bacterium]